jgi:TatD DNase family protein
MIPKYIDIHSHVNFSAFDADRDEVIRRALLNNTWVINVGTQIDTSKSAVLLANQYKEGVYAIIGLHPIHTGASYHDKKELGEGGKEFTGRGEVFDENAYRELLKNPKVVAIGECGLDYYRCNEESIGKQKEAFVMQIELANEFNKPLMLHIRNNGEDKTHNAYLDALELLKKNSHVKREIRGDVHFFAGSREDAKTFLDFGFTLSFTGVITFTHDYDEVIRNTPLEMIMSETDSPYVTPVPHRGARNEPSYVKEIVKKIAEIKGLSENEVARTIIENAKRVFKI